MKEKYFLLMLLVVISITAFCQKPKNLTKEVVSPSEQKEMEKIFLETKAEIAKVFEESGIKIYSRKTGKTSLYLMKNSFGVSLKNKDIEFQSTDKWLSVSEIYDDIRKNNYYIIYSSDDLKVALVPVYEEMNRLRGYDNKEEILVNNK